METLFSLTCFRGLESTLCFEYLLPSKYLVPQWVALGRYPSLIGTFYCGTYTTFLHTRVPSYSYIAS